MRLATLRSHPDLRDVVRLALPAIANSLLQTLVFLVDRIMLGHHSESALAAMQTVGPLVWSIVSVFGAFNVGTVAVVGRAIGARDRASAVAAARGSLVLALALGALVALVASACLGPLLDVYGGGVAVRAVAREYMRVALPAIPVFLVGMTAVSVLQAAGDTRTPLAIGIATNALNVAGNWVLVFGHAGAPRLGATGSACSTVAAATLEAVLGVYALSRASSPVPLFATGARRTMDGARRVVAVAWGSWGERVIYHAGYMAYVAFVVKLGQAAMAANQAAVSVESISWLTADGCAVAAGALVAQRLGAGDPSSARRVAWLAAALAAVILGACGLVFLLAPAPLVAAFRDDPAVVSMGARALRVAAIAQVPMAIAVVLAQSIRGAGASREALAVSFVGALGVRLVATYLCVVVLRLGLVGVWLGSTADWLVRAVVYSWRWSRGGWQRARV